jgi:hypothetical protein
VGGVSISLTVRFAILKRDRFTCVYCGAHPPQVQIEVDHFHPESRGGRTDMANLVTSCIECNRGKGTQLFDDLTGMPGEGSPLWRWVDAGIEHENARLRRRFLDREADLTLADVVEEVWPEADY